ncbi:MAG: corrinoid ABC transporter substrate-binding protein [Methanosaeta sp. PtaU1.Bin112]|nr:MAG: corrinoid ABC transporter substrate-binding protein [Methanosaeta sp. PtaU1.Bin112]
MNKFCVFLTMILTSSMVFLGQASDDVLGIFGNANMDNMLDDKDIDYVKGIIDGTNTATKLSDSNLDGKINENDLDHIDQIIAGDEKELTFVDSYGKNVTVHLPIERIAITWRGQIEMLRILGIDGDRIIGVDGHVQQNKLLFPEYQDKPSLGTVWQPDTEKILSLDPDVVFLIALSGSQGSSVVDDAAKQIESAGIPVIRFWCGAANGYATIDEEIKLLGYIFDKRDNSSDFIEWRNGILNSIREKVESIPVEEKPAVYYETGSTTKNYTISFWEDYPYISLAGGRNIFENISSSSVDPEVVVQENPDIIIKETQKGGYDSNAGEIDDLRNVQEGVLKRSELLNTNAVKNNQVYVISQYIVPWGPASGCRGSFLQEVYLAKWFHPEIFEDLDPQTIHQEYLTRFQGLDYDLESMGVFVYTPLEES